LDSRFWILDTGFWILDSRYWILDTGYWIQESGPAGHEDRATLWLKDVQYIAYWRFMFAFWLTCGYFNVFSNNVNKKMTKKALFLATF